MKLHLPIRQVLLIPGWLCISGCHPSPPSASSHTGQPSAPIIEDWRYQQPHPGKPGTVHFPIPQLIRLQNGLTLYSVRRAMPTTLIAFTVRNGASSDPPGKTGLCALTTRLLAESTLTKSAIQLAEIVNGLGSSLEAFTGYDDTMLRLSTLNEDVPQGLDILAEVLQKPGFSAANFERVRSEWLDNLKAQRQEPTVLARLAGLSLTIGPHHGASTRGRAADIARFSLLDLQNAYRHTFIPSRAALIIVGGVEIEQLIPLIEKRFGSWTTTTNPTPQSPPSLPDIKTGKLWILDRPNAEQSTILLATRFPKRDEPGYEARQVLSTLFGGLFTSRLNQNLREKHAYTYGVQSSIVASRTWGVFLIESSVRSEVTVEAFQQMEQEVQLLKDPSRGHPITLDELNRAKVSLVQALGARLEQSTLIADLITTIFSEQLGSSYGAEYPALVRSLQLANVQYEASRLNSYPLHTVVIGDRAKLEPRFASAGYPMHPLAPDLFE